MTTEAAVRQITCSNALCPEVVRTKKPQYLGEVHGTEAHIPCPRCHRVTHWRASSQQSVVRGSSIRV